MGTPPKEAHSVALLQEFPGGEKYLICSDASLESQRREVMGKAGALLCGAVVSRGTGSAGRDAGGEATAPLQKGAPAQPGAGVLLHPQLGDH